MRNTQINVFCLAVLCLLLTGCSTGPATIPAGEIHHVVLIELNDRADIPALHKANDELAHSIPGITWFMTGPPTVMARGDMNFDVGLCVTFEDEAAYRTYIEHPAHVEFLEYWRPRVKSLRIIDITSASP